MIKRIVLLVSLLASSYTTATDRYDPSAEELQCIAKNIYFESRNQSVAGRAAVGLVTINRMNDRRWPNTACGVVYQAKMRYNKILRNQCQFSWYCDGLSDTIRVVDDWKDAVYQAKNAVRLMNGDADFTEGSTHYHSINVNPWWAPSYEFVVRIDDHKFYK
tara:strand:+ start:4453 stop:4935 length:483 start_codon:yes stop_codon:yes gene_type:complete